MSRKMSASTLPFSAQPNHHHNMTVKYFIQLLFILLYSCSSNLVKTDFGKGEKQFGLHIENGPRQGFQYFDSTKTEYNYRYYTITITNDTIVPILLQINFDKTDRVQKLILLHRFPQRPCALLSEGFGIKKCDSQ